MVSLDQPRFMILDQATTTGFALWVPGSRPVTGAFTIPSTGRDVGAFLAEFEYWFEGVREQWKINFVAFELAFMRFNTHQLTGQKLFGLMAFIEYLCQRAGIKCVVVNNTDWKKHFTGKGGGKSKEMKSMVMLACIERGFAPKSQDEADAIAMMDYIAHIYELPRDWPDGALFNQGPEPKKEKANAR